MVSLCPRTLKKTDEDMQNHVEENKVFKAPEFEVLHWVDENGNRTGQVKLSDFKGKFKVVYCFQHWCPGCHNGGVPSLQKMVEALGRNDRIAFIAIQTVFEGHDANTYANMLDMQRKYKLRMPFGHDAGYDGRSRSNFMDNYRTGGTPWFVIIDPGDWIVFSGFQLNVDAAINALKSIE